jgi:Tol biopolymer transport system component
MEEPMSIRPAAGCLLLALTVMLAACGPTPAPAEKTPLPTDTLPAATALPAETSAATEVVRPAVSPTPGETKPMPGLVYTESVAGEGQVGPFLVGADGTSTQLADKTEPALSPDRTQVLYSKDNDIWILNLAAGKSKNLTRTKDRIEKDYQWWPAHPDLIVFHYQPIDEEGPGAGYLTSMKPDGSNVLLLEDIPSNSPAALSPDGRSIAYDRLGEPWIYNFGAGKMPIFPRSFTKFHLAVNPAWSPDSRRIAWQLFGIPTAEDENSEVAVLDLDTLTVGELHQYTVVGGSGISPHHLAWSPDGKWLAVANQGELSKVSLWVMSPDGSEEHPIGDGDLPIWSPDGSMLLYTDGENVYVVQAGEWLPSRVLLPERAQVIDWVKLS